MAAGASCAAPLLMSLPVLFLSHGGGPCFFLPHTPGSPFADADAEADITQSLRDFHRDVLVAKGGLLQPGAQSRR